MSCGGEVINWYHSSLCKETSLISLKLQLKQVLLSCRVTLLVSQATGTPPSTAKVAPRTAAVQVRTTNFCRPRRRLFSSAVRRTWQLMFDAVDRNQVVPL